MKKTIFIIFMTLAASSAGGQMPGFPTVPVILPNGDALQVEMARTPMERARGLMFRTDLSENQGMLFVFDRPGKNRFWMKNTLIPLDILWMDDRKRIVHIEYQVPPCQLDPCPMYGPAADSHYVLEVKAGVAHKRGLHIGMPLQF